MVGNKRIILLVNCPVDDLLRDGYFQRVSAVDFELEGFERLYVKYSKTLFSFLPVKKKIGDKIVELLMNPFNPLHLVFFASDVLMADALYLHSIYRLRSFFHKFLFLIAKKRIIDLHGSVPEELEMQEKVKESKIFKKVEKFAIKNADVIISVTEKMKEHIKSKYLWDEKNKKFLIIPILSSGDVLDFKEDIKGNEVIYCGGLQKWQQIEKMLEYVYKNKEAVKFTFLVPEHEKLKKMYLERYGEEFPGLVKAATADEVKKCYEKNAFGLVLREDHIVNNVACPTKLIEYFQNDVVPIVDSENIGDFKELGYAYVKYGNELPSRDEWEKMVMQNREVLKMVYAMFKNGSKELRNYI